MIIGIGVDIVQIPKIEKMYKTYSTSFINKILSKAELEHIQQFHSMSRIITFVASRFAAKEAVSKALGTGIGMIGFKNISTLHDTYGKPQISIDQNTLYALKQNMLISKDVLLHISISHDYPTCIVTVIAEGL